MYAGWVSSHSNASTLTPVRAIQPHLYSGGGAGGSGHNEGEAESDGREKKMEMSMSQKFTLGFAGLLGGNVMPESSFAFLFSLCAEPLLFLGFISGNEAWT